MEIKVLASSSKGNCYLIKDSRSSILIECGIPWKEIQKKLNFKTAEIDSCIISHAHQDHCRAVKDVLRAGITVHTSPEAVKVLNERGINSHRLLSGKPEHMFRINTFLVIPFELKHDIYNYGYLIQGQISNKKLVYLTDTAYSEYKFKDLNYIMIECNYEGELLKNSSLNNFVKNRIHRTHFGFDAVKDFLRANDLSKVEEILLLHLSDANSNAKLFKSEIEKLTGVPVRVC